MFTLEQKDVARKRTELLPEGHQRTPLPSSHNPVWDAVATSSHAAGPSRVQAKLAISQPGDPYEQEADRVADQVMRMPEPTVQRKCAACGGGNEPCPKCEIGQNSMLHRKADPVPGAAGSSDAASLISHLGPGQPLEPTTRAYFEPRFGCDFSHVRLHTDTRAAESAAAIQADAYAIGRNVVFGSRYFSPRTQDGQHLLAHELAHVVQQTGSDRPPLVSAGKKHGIFRYRSKGEDTIAFEGADETLKDQKTQPWIENITIVFDKVAVDDGHKAAALAAGQLEPRMPVGTLTAKYSPKSSTVLSDIVLPIVGGSTMLGMGLTDHVKNATVKRLEGLGYTDSDNIRAGNLTDPVAKSGKGARYSSSGAGTMNYAIFFKGIQAIHEGGLKIASHACVHVDDHASIRTLNHHSRIGVTTVTVKYDTTVLDNLCCHRKKTGNTDWKNNPCEKTKCP